MKRGFSWNLDSFRLLASFLIVAIHIYPFSFWGEEIDYVFTRVLFRVSVPFFFMITGYYVLPKLLFDKKKLKTYFFRILKLYGISILIYLPILIYQRDFVNWDICYLLKKICFCGPFYHLWYFPALLLGIFLSSFLLRKFDFRIVGIFFFLLYGIGIFGDSYYGVVQSVPVIRAFYSFLFSIWDYTRNGLFYAPIFLWLGYVFSRVSFSYTKSGLYSLLGLFFLMIEGMILFYLKIPRHTSMYFSLLPVSFFLFDFILQRGKGENKKFRKLSTWIYLWHPFMIVILRFFAKKISFLSFFFSYSFLFYLAVLGSTIGGFWIVCKWKKSD